MSQENSSRGNDNGRERSSSLLILLFAVAAFGVVVMLITGIHALNMSAPAMELNKLLDRKSKICADRARMAECEAVLSQIRALEKEMAKKPGEEER